jgi:hypothetical protein
MAAPNSICSSSRMASLDHLFVIYPGALRFPLAEQVEAFPLRDLTMPGALRQ